MINIFNGEEVIYLTHVEKCILPSENYEAIDKTIAEFEGSKAIFYC